MNSKADSGTWSVCCDYLLDLARKEESFSALILGADDAFNVLDELPQDTVTRFCVSDKAAVLNAAGLALGGKKPWVLCSAAAAVRDYAIIRDAIAVPRLPVRIAVYDGGLSLGREGASHHITEDLALMRAMPNMSVLVPSDENSARGAAVIAASLDGPAYLRLGASALTPMYETDPYDFLTGGALFLREGSDVTICACGVMVHRAMQAAEAIERQGINAEVIECYSIKPFPEQALLASVRRTGCCVTAEEHTHVGGLYGAVVECLSQTYPVPVRCVAIDDKFVHSGLPDELREYYGLTWREIANAAAEVWALRRR